MLADFFISVVKTSAKQAIKEELYAKLVERGILPAESQGEDDADSETSSVGCPPVMDPTLAVKLKELELAIKRQEHESKIVDLRKTEVDLKLRTLELEAESLRRQPVPAPNLPSPVFPSTPVDGSTTNFGAPVGNQVNFDAARYIKLVPQFRETEVDTYFVAFERIATKLGWPKDMWGLLLQCNFVGKAQEVCSALSIEQSLDYDVLEAAVLRAYELVPEAYRQRFRGTVKAARQTFVEFAREKKQLFDKWVLASKVTDFVQLQELILLEEFKNCIPESIVMHINEQKIGSLSDAAVVADEFALTHRTLFSSRQMKRRNFTDQSEKPVSSSRGEKDQPKHSESRRVFLLLRSRSPDNKL